jgi:hypothetical protein
VKDTPDPPAFAQAEKAFDTPASDWSDVCAYTVTVEFGGQPVSPGSTGWAVLHEGV